MKFSSLPVSFYADFAAGRRTLADWFNFAGTIGLDGADVSVAHLTELSSSYLGSLRSQADDAGVQILMIATYSDFTHPNADERRRQQEEVRDYINAARLLGSSFVRVTAGQNHPGLVRGEAIDWAVEGLTACLSAADAAGVTLLYENHTKGSVWEFVDFSQPADIYLEIVERTANSGLLLLFDTANNLVLNDDPVEILQQVKDRVAVIHTNDIVQAGHFEPTIHGTGVAPIREIFDCLSQFGFDGWISVEEASKSGEEGFRTAATHAKQLWAESSL
ncbi:MAG: sugar phosphate isomerase/epimerase family protein [Chloroflexota bacterium]